MHDMTPLMQQGPDEAATALRWESRVLYQKAACRMRGDMVAHRRLLAQLAALKLPGHELRDIYYAPETQADIEPTPQTPQTPPPAPIESLFPKKQRFIEGKRLIEAGWADAYTALTSQEGERMRTEIAPLFRALQARQARCVVVSEEVCGRGVVDAEEVRLRAKVMRKVTRRKVRAMRRCEAMRVDAEAEAAVMCGEVAERAGVAEEAATVLGELYAGVAAGVGTILRSCFVHIVTQQHTLRQGIEAEEGAAFATHTAAAAFFNVAHTTYIAESKGRASLVLQASQERVSIFSEMADEAESLLLAYASQM